MELESKPMSESVAPATPGAPRGFWLLRPRYLWPSLALAAILAAAGYAGWPDRDKVVTVTFENVHGLRAGAPVRYRGTVVGQVADVRMTTDYSAVELRVRLAPESAGFARAGTRFWVVRPSANFARGLLGLDTLTGESYLEIRPGADGEPAAKFKGDEDPLPPESPPDSLRVVIWSDQKVFALRQGAPVLCAGVPVGVIYDVKHVPADKKWKTETVIYVDHDWRHLVTDGAQFIATSSRKLRNLPGKGLLVEIDIRRFTGGIELIPDPDGSGRLSRSEFALLNEPAPRQQNK